MVLFPLQYAARGLLRSDPVLSTKSTGSNTNPSSMLTRVTKWLETLHDERQTAGDTSEEAPGKLLDESMATFTPAFVVFPDSETQNVTPIELPRAEEVALDSTFHRPKPASSKPLHISLCGKFASLFDFIDSSQAEDNADGADPLGFTVLPAGSGCGIDPGRTASRGFSFDADTDLSLSGS